MNDQAVTIQIPSSADHVSLLRALIGMYAARQNFTLEEVDDMRMAVEEAAVQLFRRSSGGAITMALHTDGPTLSAELSSAADSAEPIMDENSFSWTILSALSDDVSVQSLDGTALIRLTKVRATEAAR